MKETAETPWHERDDFWEAVGPLIFTSKIIEAASQDIEHAIAITPQNILNLINRHFSELKIVAWRFDNHFMRADTVDHVVKTDATTVQIPLDPKRRKLVGYDTHLPTGSIGA